MKLKLSGGRNGHLKDTFQRILVTASIIVQCGNLPSEEGINEPERFGTYPYKDPNKDNGYQLFGLANNDWVHVREETEEYIIFEFNFRYAGKDKKKNSMNNVILTWFNNVELVNNLPND